MANKLISEAFETVKEARASVEDQNYDIADFNYSHAEQLLKKIIELTDYDDNKRRFIELSLQKLQEEHNIIRRKMGKREITVCEAPPIRDPDVFGYPDDMPKDQKAVAKQVGGLYDDVAGAGVKSPRYRPPVKAQKSPQRSKQYSSVQSKVASTWKEQSVISGSKRKYEARTLADATLADMIESEIRLKELGEKVTLKDVAGMPDVKQRLREAIEWPTLFPELCTGLRSPITGLLLFGPPGTGKTKVAKALANLSGLEFFNVQQSVIISKEVGDSERMVRVLFDMARFYAPSILFFDEIDAIGGQRSSSTEAEASRRLKTELLVQMDGVGADKTKRVLIIGATNFPWSVDDALRRRLEKRILVPLPDYEARLDILKNLAKDTVLSKKVKLEEIAVKLEGYSGSDVVNLYTSAAQGFLAKLTHINAKVRTMDDVNRNTEKLLPQNFDIAFENIRQTVTLASQKKYEEWARDFGST